MLLHVTPWTDNWQTAVGLQDWRHSLDWHNLIGQLSAAMKTYNNVWQIWHTKHFSDLRLPDLRRLEGFWLWLLCLLWLLVHQKDIFASQGPSWFRYPWFYPKKTWQGFQVSIILGFRNPIITKHIKTHQNTSKHIKAHMQINALNA